MSSQNVNPGLIATGGMIALASAMGIGRFIYTPILPAMVSGIGLTKGDAGLIASANFLGYLIGALLAASPKITAGHRLLMLLALVLSAVSTAAMGLFDGFTAFVVLRFIGGVASAFVLVFASSLILEHLNAAGRSDLSTRPFAGVGLGIAASAVIGWWIMAEGGDWRAMWIAGGVFSAAAALAVAVLVPGGTGHKQTETGLSGQTKTARPWSLIIAYGLFGFGYVITATFIISIARSMPEVREFEAAIWLVLGLAGLPSIAFWSAIGRKSGMLTAYALACLVEAGGVLASVLWSSLTGLIVAGICLGGTFMAITALGLFAARTLAPDNARQSLALMTAAFGLGQIIGPVVAGYGYDLTGSFLLPSLIAAAALCIAAVLSWKLERA